VNAFGIPQATMRCLEVSFPIVGPLNPGLKILCDLLSWRKASRRWPILCPSRLPMKLDLWVCTIYW
jgi:hypothetical protein